MLEEQDTKQIRTILKEELQTFNKEVLLPALGQYTEEVVLPAIERSTEILQDKIGKMKQDLELQIGQLRSDMIDHVSRQVGDAKGDIIKAIKEERERDRIFKAKVLEVFERHKLAEAGELQLLRDLIE